MDEEAKLLVVKNAKDKDGFAEESITEEYPVYVTENLLQDLSITQLYKQEFRLSLCLK